MKFIITIFCLFLSIIAISQKYYEDDMPVVSMGVQVGGLFSTNLFNIRTNETDLDGLTFAIDPLNGYTIGALISLRLNRNFFFQGGINMTRRNQVASVKSALIDESVRMRFLIYEIPLFIAYYLPLTESSFLSLSTGIPIQFAPTALFSTSNDIAAESLKIGIAKPISTTIVGFEHRTLIRGGWFVGLSYTIAPWHLFLTKITYRTQPENKEYVFRHIGDHVGIVFRYYFN